MTGMSKLHLLSRPLTSSLVMLFLVVLLAACAPTPAGSTGQAAATQAPAATEAPGSTEAAPTTAADDSATAEATEAPTAAATQAPDVVTPAPTVEPAATAEMTGTTTITGTNATTTTNTTTGGPAMVSFQQDIVPIFEQNCIRCHGGEDGEKGDLNLTSHAEAMQGGEDGAVIVPGNAAESMLWQLVDEGKMPRRRPRLPQEQIDLIAQWINEGAQDN